MLLPHRTLRAAVCTSVLCAVACSEDNDHGHDHVHDGGAGTGGTGGATGSGGSGGSDAGVSSGGSGMGGASTGGVSSGGSGRGGAPTNADDAGDVADANDAIPGAHTISFQVAFGGSSAMGGNCVSSSLSGAGVATQTISLMDGSTCSMTSILGAIVACGSATCSTCAPMPCESAAQVLRLEGVADGSYTLVITGSRGTVSGTAIVCYQVSVSVVVSGADVALGTVMVPFDPDPADEALCNA